MPVSYDINDGAQALDQNLILKALDGFAWISGLNASAGNGDMTVDLTAGDAFVDGTVQSPGAGSVTLSAADADDPRKDLIYVDGTGSLAVVDGSPNPAQPDGTIREHTYAPAPPDAATLAGTPLWEVWVPAAATAIETADLVDRRVPADVVFNEPSVEQLAIQNAADAAGEAVRYDEYNPHTNDSDAHHAQDHASRHAAGGADAIDAAELSGASGSSGQVLQTDGTALQWASAAGSVEATETDDWSDLTVYQVSDPNFTTGDRKVVASVSGSGVCLGGTVMQGNADNDPDLELIVDGGPTKAITIHDSVSLGTYIAPVPTIRYESSLQIEWNSRSGTYQNTRGLEAIIYMKQ